MTCGECSALSSTCTRTPDVPSLSYELLEKVCTLSSSVANVEEEVVGRAGRAAATECCQHAGQARIRAAWAEEERARATSQHGRSRHPRGRRGRSVSTETRRLGESRKFARARERFNVQISSTTTSLLRFGSGRRSHANEPTTHIERAPPVLLLHRNSVYSLTLCYSHLVRDRSRLVL